jgi:ribosomal protein S18 acetylase RimI-like enzyme
MLALWKQQNMNDHIKVIVADRIDEDIADAIKRLVPQLSATAVIPDAKALNDIIASPCTTLLLARDQGNKGYIVGTLTLAIFTIPTGVRAWIEDVIVDESARGKGVGEALSREALRIAAAHGARTIELTTRPSRETANRLYRRLGFQPRDTNVYRYFCDSQKPLDRSS